jgi:hypothetical protein
MALRAFMADKSPALYGHRGSYPAARGLWLIVLPSHHFAQWGWSLGLVLPSAPAALVSFGVGLAPIDEPNHESSELHCAPRKVSSQSAASHETCRLSLKSSTSSTDQHTTSTQSEMNLAYRHTALFMVHAPTPTTTLNSGQRSSCVHLVH